MKMTKNDKMTKWHENDKVWKWHDLDKELIWSDEWHARIEDETKITSRRVDWDDIIAKSEIKFGVEKISVVVDLC